MQPLTFCGLLLAILVLFLTPGCAAPHRAGAEPIRHFRFGSDTFAYANGLVWEYRYDERGKWTSRRREPKPSYSQHCFVVSRSACQFFLNAVFDPQQPRVDGATYRLLVRKVVATSIRNPSSARARITIPGYQDLRSFSTEHEKMLQEECGGAWRCYFQRGNWRVVFPFSRHQQADVAKQIQDELNTRGAAVVHLVRFPQLTINHAVLVFEAHSSPERIEFLTYDPNDPMGPITITYERATKTFSLPFNAYFPGGRVDVYSIYDRLLY
jgi:hypothetical protein